MSEHVHSQPAALDDDKFAELLRQQRESFRVGVLALLLAVTSFVLGVYLLVTALIDQLD
jgi:hypothetical protein